MMKRVPSQGVEVLRLLERAGFESVLVGGAVRDLLLGRTPGDIDIATEASFSDLAALFPGGKSVGPEGKPVFLVPCGERRCEITSFCGGSLETDLARRDFTVNALALRSTGELVGTRRSKLDIELRLLRFNGSAADRLREDPLRALRLPRFAATLPGFSVAGGAYSAVRAAAPSFARCAPERIGREVRLGLEGDPGLFLRGLAASRTLHILRSLFGGGPGGPALLLQSLKRLDDRKEPLLRRTALLASFRRKLSFPDLEGASSVRAILEGWRWPKQVCSGCAALVCRRAAPAANMSRAEMADLLLAHGEAFWESVFALFGALCRVHVPRRRMALFRERFGRLAVRLRTEEALIPSGDELMERYALSSGPEVGRLLKALRTEHLLKGFASREEAMERVASLMNIR